MADAVSTPNPLERPRRPQGRAKAICITGIAVSGVVSILLLFVSPSLIGTDPVLLEALRGSTSSLAAGGAFARVGQASLVLALLAPLPTLLWVDPFYWWAGRLWGPSVAGVIFGGHPRAARWAERSARWLERSGGLAVFLAPILPVPAALVYAAAGWTGMGFVRFLFWDVLGTLAWIGLIVGLGYGVGHPAVHIAKDISHYSLEVTLGLIAVIMVISSVRSRRAQGA